MTSRPPAAVSPSRAADDETRVPAPERPSAWFGSRLADRSAVARVATVAGLAYAVLGAAFLAVGLAITGFEQVFDWLLDTDRAVTRWMAANRTDVLDAVASGLTSMANTSTVAGVLLAAGLVLYARRFWRQLIVLGVGVGLELAVFFSVTFVVARPRPDVALGAVPVTASYPSGHAAMAVVLYSGLALVAVSLTRGTRLRGLATGLAVAAPVGVGFSRVYLGLHYLSDVIAGLTLGALCLAAATVAARLWRTAP